MRFIKNGPEAPERLVQAQEDGKLIFFAALEFLSSRVASIRRFGRKDVASSGWAMA
jgi:hypothetical protein